MFLKFKCLLVTSVVTVFILAGCMTHHAPDMEGMSATEPSQDMKGMAGMADMSGMDHSKHQAMMKNKGYSRSSEVYQIPELSLTDQNGQSQFLPQLLTSDKPVVVNFIYATCTTICPLLSMGYIDLQRQLGDKSDQVLLVSVTIDPENDTPEVLNSYLQKFHAKPGWIFLTGTRAEIDQVTTAFNAFVADKMDHQPLNFIHMPGQTSWLRLNGMLNGQIFLDEFKRGGITLK